MARVALAAPWVGATGSVGGGGLGSWGSTAEARTHGDKRGEDPQRWRLRSGSERAREASFAEMAETRSPLVRRGIAWREWLWPRPGLPSVRGCHGGRVYATRSMSDKGC